MQPSATARLTCAHSSSMARSRPAPPSAAGKSMDTVVALKPGRFTWRMRASSSLFSIGVLSLIWRHASGTGSSRLPSGPMLVAIWVTSSSRMPSRGGLVTWAKSCLK